MPGTSELLIITLIILVIAAIIWYFTRLMRQTTKARQELHVLRMDAQSGRAPDDVNGSAT